MHDFTNPNKRLRAQSSLFMERFIYPHLSKEYGGGFLKFYSVCRGIAKSAEHVANPPRPKPEKRPRKGDCVQLTLKQSF